MNCLQYYLELFKKAFKLPIAIVSLISLLLAVGGGYAGYVWPELQPTLRNLIWSIPLVVCVFTVMFGLFIAPYAVHKDTVIKESNDYLRYDINARLDNVHRIFYHLHRKGLQAKRHHESSVPDPFE